VKNLEIGELQVRTRRMSKFTSSAFDGVIRARSPKLAETKIPVQGITVPLNFMIPAKKRGACRNLARKYKNRLDIYTVGNVSGYVNAHFRWGITDRQRQLH